MREKKNSLDVLLSVSVLGFGSVLLVTLLLVLNRLDTGHVIV